MRAPVERTKPRIAKVKRWPAPARGWIANENLAQSKPAGAWRMRNWFPTATGARMRYGQELYATIGDGTDDVTAIFTYQSGNTYEMFAATATDIYDVTTIADPEVSPSAAVSSLTGGAWSVVQFTTSGGTFLRCVNGADTPRVYDGSAWGTSPAITGPTAADLRYVWAHKNRLWFVLNESLTAYYLPIDSIGGAATAFPLGAVFTLGGQLLFGQSWSLDEGAGLSAHNVFVSDNGEVVVYSGSDPGDATDWKLIGVYRIGKPLGPNAWMRAGGDLIIATDIGMIPLSQAISRDRAALGMAAVTHPIETEWNATVAERNGYWNVAIWPDQQMVLAAPPVGAGEDAYTYAANAVTGAWCEFTNYDLTCAVVFEGQLFYGSKEGKIVAPERTGNDFDAAYTATCVMLYDDCKTAASRKTAKLARAVYRAPESRSDKLSVQYDFAVSLPSDPSAGAEPSSSVWGTAKWGEFDWGTGREKTIFQTWRSVYGTGYALGPAVQITSGSVTPPDVELVAIDVTYDEGDVGS